MAIWQSGNTLLHIKRLMTIPHVGIVLHKIAQFPQEVPQVLPRCKITWPDICGQWDLVLNLQNVNASMAILLWWKGDMMFAMALKYFIGVTVGFAPEIANISAPNWLAGAFFERHAMRVLLQALLKWHSAVFGQLYKWQHLVTCWTRLKLQ